MFGEAEQSGTGSQDDELSDGSMESPALENRKADLSR